MRDPLQRPARPGFGVVVARALASPMNLLVGGAGGIAGLALSSWPLAALGGLAYLALVAWDLASPSFWKKALDSTLVERGAAVERAVAQELEPSAIRDPALRDAAALVRRALDELRRVVAEGEGDALQLVDLGSSVDELAARAARLVHGGDEIARHLSREDPNALRREIDRLEQRAKGAHDPSTARQWSEAAQARREHLQVLGDLAAAQDRILASLSRIAAALDGLSAKVVRMGALDAQAQGDLSGDMNSELSRINAEVNAFEETLRPLVAAGVTA
jgi:hypothetical protein